MDVKSKKYKVALATLFSFIKKYHKEHNKYPIIIVSDLTRRAIKFHSSLDEFPMRIYADFSNEYIYVNNNCPEGLAVIKLPETIKVIRFYKDDKKEIKDEVLSPFSYVKFDEV